MICKTPNKVNNVWDCIVIIVDTLCGFINFFFHFIIAKRITIKQKKNFTGAPSKWKSGNCHFLDHLFDDIPTN